LRDDFQSGNTQDAQISAVTGLKWNAHAGGPASVVRATPVSATPMYRVTRHPLKIVVFAACCLSLLAGESAFGQVLRGDAALGGWRDDKPGVRRLLTPQDLPAISKPTYGAAQVAPAREGARPKVPEGFSVELVTTDAHKPRVIRAAPNGDLFVADSMFNSVRVLRVPAGSARPEKDVVFASGLKQPYGIAFYPLGPDPRWAGKPTGEYEDFMTGFVLSDTQVWGRPVGVAVANDGSLFVTEDGNGTIWRVAYKGATP
jgi:glucose/arabinose dehydrogenase